LPRLAELSEQRSDLAQKLISTQESTLRHISANFMMSSGKVLTAIGSMLGRAGRHAPEGSPLREESERGAGDRAIDTKNIRTLSRHFIPFYSKRQGLESTSIGIYFPRWDGKMGLALHYEKTGNRFPWRRAPACIFIACCKKR